MTLRDLVEHVIALRKAQLEQDLEATLNADSDFTYDDDGGVITLSFHGHCKKVHPDVVHLYPNGWGMLQEETLDEALDKLNLTLELKSTERQFVIVSDSEEGYWSNETGWGDEQTATRFTEEETFVMRIPLSRLNDARRQEVL